MTRRAPLKLKYCGMTRQQDVDEAIALGVDALGFIFFEKSPRSITVEQARVLTENLPPFVSVVGVFVNEKKSVVQQAIDSLPLTHCQFHGDESAAFCQQFKMPYIKAVRVKDAQSIVSASLAHPKAAALLLDTYVKGCSGGTGLSFDWSVIPRVSQPYLLAGGLNINNLTKALQTQAYALDVCSGVETRPGVKDPGLMAQMMNAVRSYHD